jgi:hypothetical protein
MFKFKNKSVTSELFNSPANANDYLINNLFNRVMNLNLNKYDYTIRLNNDSDAIIIFNLTINKVYKTFQIVSF